MYIWPVQPLQTQIVIVGAGPGGAAAALKLHALGIPCVLIDQAVFPRDKVCGDAISGKAATLLNRLDPEFMASFRERTDQQIGAWGIQFVAPNGTAVDIPFKFPYDKDREPAPGYVAKRLDFDQLLIEKVLSADSIQFHQGIRIEHYERTALGYRISNSDGTFIVDCTLLILADGANSGFARKEAGLEKDLRHHAGAVRAYFKNVEPLHPDNFIELHYLKEVNPGYFWIFPLPNGYANVGLGMRSDFIKKQKINLREVFLQTVKEHPLLAHRFSRATLESPVLGYGLPLGSRPRPISGDHYLLVGDAGHLIDPLTGEGIGNAIYSGFIAAEQAQKCLETDDYSASFLKAYDQRVARVLGSEMKLSYQLQRMLRYPWLTNTLANWISRHHWLVELISRMYTDLELRKQLVNPLFWGRVLKKLLFS
ncbi:MAG: geranylgeranyl reductase family protein [Lewinellaceae bacterium]|nr:geranylgeranyl reductase family protein [Lewinellaceae bacterium]